MCYNGALAVQNGFNDVFMIMKKYMTSSFYVSGRTLLVNVATLCCKYPTFFAGHLQPNYSGYFLNSSMSPESTDPYRKKEKSEHQFRLYSMHISLNIARKVSRLTSDRVPLCATCDFTDRTMRLEESGCLCLCQSALLNDGRSSPFGFCSMGCSWRGG